MTRTVITATPDMTAAQAGKRMVEHKIGSVIIVKEGKPLGIVTESDMVAKVIFKNVKPSAIRLEQLMSRPLITTRSSDDVNDAVLKMAQKKIRRLPVIDGDELVGIITDTDIIQISSELNHILENLVHMNREIALDRREVPTSQGECEICDEYSQELQLEEGHLKCPTCRGNVSSGVCEVCGQFSDMLEYANGSIICESCKESDR
ncbi:MAG: CBS domain-containing protein [Euryarchaeota archaeon]|nr:CBS domain-containing protein [Euryarchaeota archaeon]